MFFKVCSLDLRILCFEEVCVKKYWGKIKDFCASKMLGGQRVIARWIVFVMANFLAGAIRFTHRFYD